jgi:hypothetical protein
MPIRLVICHSLLPTDYRSTFNSDVLIDVWPGEENCSKHELSSE